MKRLRGFTLIELMVVVGIIAILAAIGLTVYSQTRKSARDAKRKADIRVIASALEQYYAANQKYPDIGAISCESNWNTLHSALAPYIEELPRDPQNICNWDTGRFYKYHPIPFGTTSPTSFQLAASLEITTDKNTGNFTYACAVGADVCIFRKEEGGYGAWGQQ